MALAVDETVAAFRATGSFDSNPTTATSAEFTPPAGALLDVSVHAFESIGNHAVSSVITGGGLTWHVAAENGADFNGGAAGSEGYVGKHWAISDGQAITLSATVNHQDNSNGYPISAKVRIWTGQDVTTPVGLAVVSGPDADTGAGINVGLLPDASVDGQLVWAATEHNDGSGSAGSPSSTDPSEANFEASLMATLSGYKSADHAINDAVSINLNSVGATKWNSAGFEVKAASGEVTGDLALTEGADVAAFAGQVIVGGALAVTEAADVAELAGQVLVQGALALTEAADVPAIVGDLEEFITGTLALTEAADVAAIAGGVLVSGALALTEQADSVAIAEGLPCTPLVVNVRDPNVTDAIASAMLDRFGRFAKSEDQIAVVRLFFPATYCSTTYDLTAAQFRALTAAKRTEINNLGSAAGLIDTAGKSNA